MFEKLMNFTPNFCGKSFFPEDSESANLKKKLTQNNSQGSIFVVISCQRVLMHKWEAYTAVTLEVHCSTC